MAVSITPELLGERLVEARQSYKLNVGYAGMSQLPAGFAELVKKHNPHILELELSSNNLTSVPDELGDFKHLRVLRLKYNQLRKLPPVVAQLPQLAVLELAGNQISKIDSSVMAAMTSLKELDLSGNVLADLPAAIARLPKLEALHLENNRLESLPEEIGELPALVRLNVSTNALRTLPASMGRLRKIQRIDAANNMLVRVPPSMGYLKTIKELNLRYNNLDERYKNKIEEGLSRLLSFLREEAERERLEEIERLKPIGTAVGPYTEYRCKAEVGQSLRLEFGDFVVDNRCWIRSGHSITQVNHKIYAFGGILTKDGACTNELFWMTTERMEWHSQPTRGDKPCPRHGHVAVYDPEHHQLVVFGGRTAERKRLNDVHLLDLDSWQWKKATCEGAGPTPREGAAADYHAGYMVLFGGHAAGGRTNDLFLLELSRLAWSQPTTSGPAPSPRSGAAACVGAGRYLFVSGGRNNFVLEDLAVMDLISRSWLEVSLGGAAPPPRHSHLLSVHDQSLFLFGGLDELGAPSLRLFKLPVPRAALAAAADAAALSSAAGAATGGAQGQAGGSSAGAGAGGGAGSFRGEWEEVESELTYNRSRAVVLHRGCINIYQLGSSTMGKPNDDDAEKGLVFWDVFKTAKLEDLRPCPPPAEDPNAPAPAAAGAAGATGARGAPGAGAPAGKAARVQHSSHSASKMPAGFMSVSDKEARMLAYIRDFAHIFQELYPHRRPLYLTPPNECNIPKFVCTTLRPSLLPYPDLYTLEGACRFVSEYVTFEALENPLHPPTHLPSPHSVLAWQAGDSFDCAGLLASMLIGAGFDAYVVMGYAPRAVTLCDLRGEECPLATDTAALGPPSDAASAPAAAGRQRPEAGGSGGAAAAAGVKKDEPGKRKKYQLRPKPALASKYVQEQEAEAAAAAAAAAAQPAGAAAAAAAARRSSTSSVDGGGGAAGEGGRKPSDAGSGSGSGGAALAAEVSLLGAAEASQAEVDAADLQHSKRVHAWVLVLPGRREIMEPWFLEPSTGRRYSPSDCPYQGIEFVWSSANFWICMQAPEPHSDARAAPASVSWDLSDPTKWEAVLDASQGRPGTALEDTAGPAAFNSTRSCGEASRFTAARGTSQLSVSAMAALRPKTPGAAALAATSRAGLGSAGLAAASPMPPGTPGSAVGPGGPGAIGGGSMLRTPSRVPGLSGIGALPPGTPGSSHGPNAAGQGSGAGAGGGDGGSVKGGGGPGSEHARSEYARSEYGGESATRGLGGVPCDDDGACEAETLPDLPPSWVPELAVPRDQYDMRCPRGARTTLYHRCQVEVFARFGDCSRWDGLVQRLTRYADDARTIPVEVHELFERRKDKLKERRALPQQDTVVERFAPGSLFDVRDITTERGKRRVIHFYSRARLDGLVRREEITGVKISEVFTGREDRLEYRSATFGGGAAATAAAAGGGDAPAAGGAAAGAGDAGGGAGGGERSLAMAKMAEKFARDPSKSADEDVAKRVFYVAQGRVELRHHLGEGRVTAGYVVMQRDGPAQAVQIDPLAPKPRALDLLQLFRVLQSAERDAGQAVRDSEWESREIARVRAGQEQSIALEVPYYDVARVKAENSDDEPPDEASSTSDYLTPFLPPGLGAGGLAREQCLGVRERCLRALKDRLVQRANIIQARLDDEQAGLSRRQAAFARDREMLTPAEEEEHEWAVQEAGFRIGILQRRLARHEDAALAKYYELDRRLRNDPRLALLLVPA